MKHSKKLLVGATALIITMQSNAENLSGRTRNLNIFRCNKHMWVQSSAEHNDSGNIFRDLAYNCDSSGDHESGRSPFRLNVTFSIEPFEMLNKLGHFETLQDLENFLSNPMSNPVALAYLQKLEAETADNMQAYTEDNLKEMLFSVDQDGKTVSDILQEKKASGKIGCILLNELFENMKRGIVQKELIQKEKKEIEDLVSRLMQ